MRMLLSLIGYAATATVITLAAGFGYLWQSERLTDERMFRIVAILHGVDTSAESEAEDDGSEDQTLSEEPSLMDQQRIRDLALRDQEVRLESLRRHRIEFDHAREILVAQSARSNKLAQEFEQRINQENATNADEEIRKVLRNLKEAEPDLAKDLLLRILKSGNTAEEKQKALDQAVVLIKLLPPTSWKDILDTFRGEEEIAQLHRLHLEALKGGAKQRVLDDAARQFKNPTLNNP